MTTIAARFTNWLHNGQGNVSTETGAYTLNGAITRNADAKYWIPTENEWYKAAYHKNNGATDSYFDYPTSSDSIDTSMANYNRSVGNMTDVGKYDEVPSPYETFDLGGNVWEWNETALGPSRVTRGGSWYGRSSDLLASTRLNGPPFENNVLGFRVATVPEPGSLTLMLCGAIAALLYCWRRRK